jgi:Nucleotidyl transferase AbiEii toxin, Type IV TA system
MLVGGLAVGVWVEPRATRDIDLAIVLVPSLAADFFEALRERGAVFALSEAERAAKEGGPVRVHVPFSQGVSTRVDLLIAGTDFERGAVARRRRATLFSHPIWVASPDDLLLYKLIAGRPQDLADIDRLLRAHITPEDESYVLRCAEEWGLSDALADVRLRAART